MTMIQCCLARVSSNIVDPDTVQFGSRQVAAVSGNARRSLGICRRAFEIAKHSCNKDTDDNEPPSNNTGTGQVTIAAV
ncbi:hypothetical protein L873DRAFT_1801671, partial [Choiromyces venosus 120613-1]